MRARKGPFRPIPWDSFGNSEGIPGLIRFDIERKTGEHITINPMNPEKHTLKAPWVHSPSVFYSLPYVIDEADSEVESTSRNDQAIYNRQKGKIIVCSKSGVLDQLGLPEFFGQSVINDTVEVAVLYDQESGKNYTLHYDVKIDTL